MEFNWITRYNPDKRDQGFAIYNCSSPYLNDSTTFSEDTYDFLDCPLELENWLISCEKANKFIPFIELNKEFIPQIFN